MDIKGIKGGMIIGGLLLVVLVPVFLAGDDPLFQLLAAAIIGLIAFAMGSYFFYREYYRY